jgi:hypothetical protein
MEGSFTASKAKPTNGASDSQPVLDWSFEVKSR